MSNGKNRRGGLGRGLGALIPTAAPEVGAAGAAATPASATVPGVPSVSSGRPSPVDSFFTPTAPESAAQQSAAQQSAPEEDAAPDSDAASTPGQTSNADPGEDGLVAVAGATFAELPIESIHPNAKQPRQVFDEDALAELTHSIREFGVLQPVVVRPDPAQPGTYELVMGERRYRATQAAGLTTIPAIVRSTADDAMLRDALLENIHRAQLNPLEEAAAYQQLLEEFGVTHDELARRIGRSRPQVSNTIRLLNLSVPVQRRVAAGVLSAGHARALLSLEDNETQDELAARIVAEGLSVRATEELVALHVSGHAQKKAVRKSLAPRITAPAVSELADKLSDVFDTRVKVDLGRSKGKITVEFASIDDLERIVGLMAPQLAVRRLSTHPGAEGDAAETEAGTADTDIATDSSVQLSDDDAEDGSQAD